jgi:molybdopterin/thiamine biosynthesis adenylyltransferase
MEAQKLEPEFLNRSFPILSEKGIRHLATRRIAVAGCGGVGGSLAMTLARMGAGKFHLSDPANFDKPDMNRQWGALNSTLGRPKVDVYRDLISDINPQTEIKLFPQGVTPHNQDEFLEGVDILIDCLDASVAYELRESMHAKARAKKIFSVVAPILGFGCVAMCSSPYGMSMKAWTDTFKQAKTKTDFPDVLKQIFMPEHLELIGKSLPIGRIPSVAVGPAIATSLLATECMAYLLDGIIPGFRKPMVLPKVMFFDLFRMSYHVLDASPVFQQAEKEVG